MTDLGPDDVVVSRTEPENRVGVFIGVAAGAVHLKITHGDGLPETSVRMELNAALAILQDLAAALNRAAALRDDIADDAALDRGIGTA